MIKACHNLAIKNEIGLTAARMEFTSVGEFSEESDAPAVSEAGI